MLAIWKYSEITLLLYLNMVEYLLRLEVMCTFVDIGVYFPVRANRWQLALTIVNVLHVQFAHSGKSGPLSLNSKWLI